MSAAALSEDTRHVHLRYQFCPAWFDLGILPGHARISYRRTGHVSPTLRLKELLFISSQKIASPSIIRHLQSRFRPLLETK